MQILAYETPYWQSNTYLILENTHCIVIDPCEIDAIKKMIDSKDLILDYAILTHEHCDHITGVDWVKSKLAKVVCSYACADRIKDPRLNAARYYNVSSQIQKKLRGTKTEISENFTCTADIFFNDKLELTWQGHYFNLIETPGHTVGGICIYIDNKILFTGDSLFQKTSTNVLFPSGNKKMFEQITLPWIYSLPNTTLVYPGHFEPFLLKDRDKKIDNIGL